MSDIVYCEKWNEVKRGPINEITPSIARKRHLNKKPYSAWLRDKACVIDLTFFKAYCTVHFLDKLNRVDTRYTFEEIAGSKLFLAQASVHSYEDAEAFPFSGVAYRFFTDGRLVKTETNRRDKKPLLEETRLDVSKNYVTVPQFGKYDSVSARER